MSYTALIRTFNSASTLPATLTALSNQTRPPAMYVLLDSGSTDGTLELAPAGAVVQRFRGNEFNYSQALNQGLEQVRTEYVLVISSHTAVEHPQALAVGIDLLDHSETLGAAYFAGDEPDALSHRVIDASNFDGFNGVWNTAALFRRSLLIERPFRPEVFSAEDQEWSHWLVMQRKLAIARIDGAGLRNNNPLRWSRKKLVNEYLAIALFVDSSLLAWRNIVRTGFGAIKPTSRRSRRERAFKLALFCRLLACRLVDPRAKPRTDSDCVR